MRRIVVGIVTMFVVMLGIATAPPASAACSGGTCNSIKHYTPDTGYDASILIRCVDGRKFYLSEGMSSRTFCNDTGAVYVRTNEELWCKRIVNVSGYASWKWVKSFDATGWHGLGPNWVDGDGCTVRRD